MAASVYLFLKIGGMDVQGESPIQSLGRANSIPCLTFDQNLAVAATGARSYQPLLIRKRIDKSTPLLAKALTTNQKADAQFRFFRPNPTGDGTEEQYFTIALKDARIVGQHIVTAPLPDVQSAREPAVEEIAFAVQTISWTYTNGGITHSDSVPAGRG